MATRKEQVTEPAQPQAQVEQVTEPERDPALTRTPVTGRMVYAYNPRTKKKLLYPVPEHHLELLGLKERDPNRAARNTTESARKGGN